MLYSKTVISADSATVIWICAGRFVEEDLSNGSGRNGKKTMCLSSCVCVGSCYKNGGQHSSVPSLKNLQHLKKDICSAFCGRDG